MRGCIRDEFLVGYSLDTFSAVWDTINQFPLSSYGHCYLVVPRSILDACEDENVSQSMIYLEEQNKRLKVWFHSYRCTLLFRGNEHKMPESCGSKALLFHHDMSVQYEPKRYRIWAKLCKPVQIYVMQKLSVVLKTKPPLKGQNFRTTSTLIMYTFCDGSNSTRSPFFKEDYYHTGVCMINVWGCAKSFQPTNWLRYHKRSFGRHRKPCTVNLVVKFIV